MHEHLHGIGAVARQSGLPVSALRFYDAAGVLRPAWTDPATGYRWYSADQVDQARLVARLRQVEMPLTGIAEVLASRHRPAAAQTVLDRHHTALESRLAVAREHLSGARDLLADPPSTRFDVAAGDLVQAFAAVRYAVSSEPSWPALTGILLDLSDGMLRLVACDRARLAIAEVPVRRLDGPPVQVIAPLAVLEALPDGAGVDPSSGTSGLTVELRVDRVAFGAPGAEPVTAEPVAAEYPDYRALLRASWVLEVCVPTYDLVSRVMDRARGAGRLGDEVSGAGRAVQPASGVRRGKLDVVAVLLGDRGVDVVQPGVPGSVTFDRTYLLEAIAATGGGDVVLALDAVRHVLRVAREDRLENRSLLMPLRV